MIVEPRESGAIQLIITFVPTSCVVTFVGTPGTMIVQIGVASE